MSKKIDYEEPFILEALFKYQEVEGNEPVGEPQEKVQEVAANWFDIVEIRSYVYDDSEWESHAGPKFYITFRETGTYLVKGVFKEMFNLWKKYCKEFYGKGSES
jgi:hypothetical protein